MQSARMQKIKSNSTVVWATVATVAYYVVIGFMLMSFAFG